MNLYQPINNALKLLNIGFFFEARQSQYVAV